MSKYPTFTLRRKGTELKSSTLLKHKGKESSGKRAMPHDTLSPLCLEHKDPVCLSGHSLHIPGPFPWSSLSSAGRHPTIKLRCKSVRHCVAMVGLTP